MEQCGEGQILLIDQNTLLIPAQDADHRPVENPVMVQWLESLIEDQHELITQGQIVILLEFDVFSISADRLAELLSEVESVRLRLDDITQGVRKAPIRVVTPFDAMCTQGIGEVYSLMQLCMHDPSALNEFLLANRFYLRLFVHYLDSHKHFSLHQINKVLTTVAKKTVPTIDDSEIKSAKNTIKLKPEFVTLYGDWLKEVPVNFLQNHLRTLPAHCISAESTRQPFKPSKLIVVHRSKEQLDLVEQAVKEESEFQFVPIHVASYKEFPDRYSLQLHRHGIQYLIDQHKIPSLDFFSALNSLVHYIDRLSYNLEEYQLLTDLLKSFEIYLQHGTEGYYRITLQRIINLDQNYLEQLPWYTFACQLSALVVTHLRSKVLPGDDQLPAFIEATSNLILLKFHEQKSRDGAKQLIAMLNLADRFLLLYNTSDLTTSDQTQQWDEFFITLNTLVLDKQALWETYTNEMVRIFGSDSDHNRWELQRNKLRILAYKTARRTQSNELIDEILEAECDINNDKDRRLYNDKLKSVADFLESGSSDEKKTQEYFASATATINHSSLTFQRLGIAMMLLGLLVVLTGIVMINLAWHPIFSSHTIQLLEKLVPTLSYAIAGGVALTLFGGVFALAGQRRGIDKSIHTLLSHKTNNTNSFVVLEDLSDGELSNDF